MPLGINSVSNASLSAQRSLNRAIQSQQGSFQKLSSGFKINQAGDNPAGLVISEYLRGQLGGIDSAMRNTQEAYNTLSIAEGGLSQVSGMLTGMRALALHALNRGVTSPGQTGADQAELDGLLGSIANLVQTTSYSNMPLLNGAQEIAFSVSGDTFAVDAGATSISNIAEGTGQVEVKFAGGVENQAEKAYVESAAVAGGALSQETALTVKNAAGAGEDFTFAAGTTVEEMAAAINARGKDLDLEAYAFNGGTQLRVVSANYGSTAFVQVDQGAGQELFAPDGQSYDRGQDATIVANGKEVKSDALKAQVTTSTFSGTLAFQEGEIGNPTIAQIGYGQDTLTNAEDARSFQLTDIHGGRRLQLGETAGSRSREVFGINNMDPSRLGQVAVAGENYRLADLASGGTASLANNPEAALAVIDQAITEVSSQRAQIGAYQSGTLQRNLNSFSVAAENVAATESGIRDTNLAEEISNLVRAQILGQVGLMAVQAHNTNAQNVLRLLGAG